ncbi:exopolyphosphatase [Fluviicola sp.]|jgi:exopolyphosphatase/guanosine-5'-triphosphate,3'-diphosphate pyrophosphatase|uniref:Ppx/GppA phosphatase family protein n=1 Tax=Fluviicola sp. TaxID=1917219 RepID=UPI0028332F78|nr:exopolyphosphatase [Fluviicola sp.]MDR0801425.1 rod shape-determining protein [Fluviicola sp.]
MPKRYAAIDIGSNAVRLLIGEISKENGHPYVKKISYTRLPLRLGEEVFDSGEISMKKADDFIKTIEVFRLIADIFNVSAIRACATSAMREARNGAEVIQQIKRSTGIQIEVISGDEEARLIFGTFALLDIERSKPYLVIDVGGGSTEINVFEHGKRVAAKSFDIGTVRMLKDKVDKKCWKEMKLWIKEHVEDNPHLVYATGGNINKIHKLLGVREKTPVTSRAMNQLHAELEPLSIGQRMDLFQLKPDRADVIVPALEIFRFCMNVLKCKEMYVPKIGLSDGIIYDLHKKKM